MNEGIDKISQPSQFWVAPTEEEAVTEVTTYNIEPDTLTSNVVSLKKLAFQDKQAMQKAANESQQLQTLSDLGKAIVDCVPEKPMLGSPTPESKARELKDAVKDNDKAAKEINEASKDLRVAFAPLEQIVEEIHEDESAQRSNLEMEERTLEHIAEELQTEDSSFNAKQFKTNLLDKLEKINQKLSVAGKDLKHVKHALYGLQNIIKGIEAEDIVGSILAEENKQLSEIIKEINSYNKTETKQDKVKHLNNVLQGLQKFSSSIKEQKARSEKVLGELDKLDRAISKIRQKLENIENDVKAAKTLADEFDKNVTENIGIVDRDPNLTPRRKKHIEGHFKDLNRKNKEMKKRLVEEKQEISTVSRRLDNGKKKAAVLHKKTENLLIKLNETEAIVSEAIKLFEETVEVLEGVEIAGMASETIKGSLEAVAKSAESAAASQGAGALGAVMFLASIPTLALKGKAHHVLKKQNAMFKEALKPVMAMRVKLEKQRDQQELGSAEYQSLQEAIGKLDQKINPLKGKVEELTKLQKTVAREMAGEAGKAALLAFAAGALIAHGVLESAEHAAEVAQAAEQISEAAVHTATTAASHAAIVAGVGVGLVGILGMGVSSKGLHTNKKTDEALKKEFLEIYKQLAQAEKDGNKVLHNILLLRIANLESQQQDNLVSTIRNSLTFTSSMAGTAVGTMTVIAGGVATGALGAAVLATGIGGAVIGGAALIGGGGYLIYKKRHAIAHGTKVGKIALKQSLVKQQLKRIDKKLDETTEKIDDTAWKLKLKNNEASEKKIIRMEKRALDEKHGRLMQKREKLEVKVDELAQKRASEKEQYKYKKHMAKFTGDHKPDVETMQALEKQFSMGTNADTIREFLQHEKEAGRFHGNLATLETENPNPEDTFGLLMEYATAKVTIKKEKV